MPCSEPRFEGEETFTRQRGGGEGKKRLPQEEGTDAQKLRGKSSWFWWLQRFREWLEHGSLWRMGVGRGQKIELGKRPRSPYA